MCFVFRQHKAVADVLQCNDDDDNGNYYFLCFSEEEARRSLLSELNTRLRGVEDYILTTLQSLKKMILYNQLKECHSWTRGPCLQ
jgi:hypothetical protein